MMMVSPFFGKFSRGAAQLFSTAPSTAHGARSAAATESLLRRRCADQLRRAHSARRVRGGADAAATELMLRAALLRLSCEGVAAARSCADQLRRAHSTRRVRDGADAAATELMLRASALLRRSDATRRLRPAFIFSRVGLNFNGPGPQSQATPPAP